MFRHGKKALLASIATLAIASGGAAFAFWSGGQGTGQGQIDDANLTLKANFSLEGMTPGHVTDVTFLASNDGTTGTGIHELTTTVEVTPQAGKTCPPGSFSFSYSPTIMLFTPFQVPAGAVDLPVMWGDPLADEPAAAELEFVNLADNQDGCRGATVIVHVTAT